MTLPRLVGTAKRRLDGAAQRSRRSLSGFLKQKICLPTFEFNLADTCNLRCAHCSASSPFLSQANLPDLDTFIRSLSFLLPVMESEELSFKGGEPLLNRQILDFMRAAKQSGVVQRINVTTNGLLLPKMSPEFWELADTVSVSLYPSARERLPESLLASLQEVAARSRCVLEIMPFESFFVCISEQRIVDPQFVQRTFDTCKEAHEWPCHLLYRDRFYRCSRVHTLDRYLTGLGEEHSNFTEEDGILLDERKSLFPELRDYLRSKTPLQSCSYCFGTSGPLLEHRQLTVEEVRAGRKAS
jgi:organic radical activating enzyme